MGNIILPPDASRKELYNNAPAVLTKRLLSDGSISAQDKSGIEVLPPSAERANNWTRAPATPSKVLYPDGSIHETEIGVGGDVGGGESNLMWRPAVDIDGNLTWIRSTETIPPDPQNIKGPPGSGEGGGIAEAPADGILRGRKDAGWQVIDAKNVLLDYSNVAAGYIFDPLASLLDIVGNSDTYALLTLKLDSEGFIV